MTAAAPSGQALEGYPAERRHLYTLDLVETASMTIPRSTPYRPANIS